MHGTVLLNVYSRTCTTIFIEISLYLTNTEQKISCHFFETRCVNYNISSPAGSSIHVQAMALKKSMLIM